MVQIISIKNLQFTLLKEYIKDICPNCGTVEQTTAPPSFPYLTFVLMDNPCYKKSQDSDSKENHVQTMFQVDVYMNDNNMYKAEQVIAKADECLQSYGWERIFGAKPISSGMAGVARQTARYQAIVKQTAPNDYTVI